MWFAGKTRYEGLVAIALSTIAFVALFVVGAAALLGLVHRALRASEMHARSAIALRELEPRGGRHRFHVRLFEMIALSCACVSALGVLMIAAASPAESSGVELLVIGGAAIIVASWWAWRRGALRAVEQPAEHETGERP